LYPKKDCFLDCFCITYPSRRDWRQWHIAALGFGRSDADRPGPRAALPWKRFVEPLEKWALAANSACFFVLFNLVLNALLGCLWKFLGKTNG
jgi:hypothetical protein